MAKYATFSPLFQNPNLGTASRNFQNTMFGGGGGGTSELDPSQIWANEQLARQRASDAAQQEWMTKQWQTQAEKDPRFWHPSQVGTPYSGVQKGISHAMARDMILQGTDFANQSPTAITDAMAQAPLAQTPDGASVSNAMLPQPITSEADWQRAGWLMGRGQMDTGGWSAGTRQDNFDASLANNLEKQRIADIAAGQRQTTVNEATLEKQRIANIGAESQQRLVNQSAETRQSGVNVTSEFRDQRVLSPSASQQLIPNYQSMSQEDLSALGYQRVGDGLRAISAGSKEWTLSEEVASKRNIGAYFRGASDEVRKLAGLIPPEVFDALQADIAEQFARLGNNKKAGDQVMGSEFNDGVTFIEEADGSFGGEDTAISTKQLSEATKVFKEWAAQGEAAKGRRIVFAWLEGLGYSHKHARSIIHHIENN